MGLWNVFSLLTAVLSGCILLIMKGVRKMMNFIVVAGVVAILIIAAKYIGRNIK